MERSVAPNTNIHIGSEPVPQESEVQDLPLKPEQNLPVPVNDVEKDNEPTQQPVVLGSGDHSSCGNNAEAAANITLNGQEHHEDGLEKREPSPIPECNTGMVKSKKRSFATMISEHCLHSAHGSNIKALAASNNGNDNSSIVDSIHSVTCSDEHQRTMLGVQHQNPSEINTKTLGLQATDQNYNAKASETTRQNFQGNLSERTTVTYIDENEANSQIKRNSRSEDQPLVSSSTDSSSLSIQRQQKIATEDDTTLDNDQKNHNHHSNVSENACTTSVDKNEVQIEWNNGYETQPQVSSTDSSSTTIQKQQKILNEDEATQDNEQQPLNFCHDLSRSAIITSTNDNEANLLIEPLVSSTTYNSWTENNATRDSGQQSQWYNWVAVILQRVCKFISDYKKMLGIALFGIVFFAVVIGLGVTVRQNHKLENIVKNRSVILNDTRKQLRFQNETIQNLKDDRENLTEKLAMANQVKCPDYSTPGSQPFPCNLTGCRKKTLNRTLSFEAENTSTAPFPMGCSATRNWVLYGRPRCSTERGKYAELHVVINPNCPDELQFSCICTGRKDKYAYTRDVQMHYTECPRG